MEISFVLSYFKNRSLDHNQLTGTIPTEFAETPLRYL